MDCFPPASSRISTAQCSVASTRLEDGGVSRVQDPESSRSSLSREKEKGGDVKVEGEWRDEDIEYPDGGLRAWLVVVGAMLTNFSTFGFANAWGVFQSYYETDILPTTSPSTIAWIGSLQASVTVETTRYFDRTLLMPLQYALVFSPGIFMGRLCDLGYFRVPFTIGITFAVVAAFLLAECTQYWHFLLCQGLFLGLGSGIAFGATLPIIGHWFLKRRGLAMGLTALGASAGGTVYPIAARQLIPLVGKVLPLAFRNHFLHLPFFV
ncbi:monocarboxylate permease [Coprinopsis cinerea AmutBmut pab1-1]|nr:monocarboxylate permease [Coprinopsis cinerea AmutBmut pab1-1]